MALPGGFSTMFDSAQGATFAGPTRKSETKSLKQLKASLRGALAESGALDAVKAQIRRDFISSLSSNSSNKTAGTGSANGGSGGGRHMDLQSRIALSAAYHFLKKRGLVHSLSVFAAESGLDSKGLVLSEVDIIGSLNVGQQLSSLLLLDKGKENEERGEEGEGIKSAFELVLDHCYSLARKNTCDGSVQTDEQKEGAREALDSQVRSLRDSFISRLDQERLTPSRGIEERMLSYQRECDERAQKNLVTHMALFRETQLAKIRLEESQRARLDLQTLRIEMEADYQRRMAVQVEREEEMSRMHADKERKSAQQQYEARQKMQLEIDDMRSREQASGRKLEMESQGLRMLDLRLQEIKAALEGRERDIVKREREVNALHRESIERAREEARTGLKSELEALMRDRKNLILERQRLDDERGAQAAALESAASTRQLFKECQVALATKEAQVEELQIKCAKQMAIINGEDASMGGKSQHLVLIQRNAELEAKLPALEHAMENYKQERNLRERAEGINVARHAEIERLKAGVEAMAKRADSERATAESLRRELQSEKMRYAAAQHKSDELEQLLNEKRKTIASLMKQGSVYLGVDGSSSNSATSYTQNLQRSAQKKAEDFATALLASRRNSTSRIQGVSSSAQDFPSSSSSSSSTTSLVYGDSTILPPPHQLSQGAPSPLYYHPPPQSSHIMHPQHQQQQQQQYMPESSISSSTTGGAGDGINLVEARRIESIRSSIEKQKLAVELESLEWERLKVEKQRTNKRDEEALETARLEAESLRLETEKLELQRRKQTFLAQHELQLQQAREVERQRTRREDREDELLDRTFPVGTSSSSFSSSSTPPTPRQDQGEQQVLLTSLTSSSSVSDTSMLPFDVPPSLQQGDKVTASSTPASISEAAITPVKAPTIADSLSSSSKAIKQTAATTEVVVDEQLDEFEQKQREMERLLKLEAQAKQREEDASAAFTAAAAAAAAAADLAALQEQERVAEEERQRIAEERRLATLAEQKQAREQQANEEQRLARIEAEREEEEKELARERERKIQLELEQEREREQAELDAAARAKEEALANSEEARKKEADAAAIADARAKVLARRKQKSQQEQQDSLRTSASAPLVSAPASVSAHPLSASSSATASKEKASSNLSNINFSTNDSDVEITGGDRSSEGEDSGVW